MKKRLLGLLLAVMLLVTLVPTAFADDIDVPVDVLSDGIDTVETVADVPYLDEYGAPQTADCTPLTGDMQVLESGWYVVQGYQQFKFRIQVTGDVHIILADGCTLDAKEGIHVPGGNINPMKDVPHTSLTVYAQSTDNPGSIHATSFHWNNTAAAIGGDDDEHSGIITINGGIVEASVVLEAYGRSSGAAIGGGASGDAYVTINGGSVTAHAWSGAGIGSGEGYGAWGGAGAAYVTVNGGKVSATSKKGGAIGTGNYGEESVGEIVINGGDVDAVSEEGEAFAAHAGGFAKLTPPADKLYRVSSENGELAGSPYVKAKDIADDVSGCRELHLSVEPMYRVEYILNMPDELSHTFDKPKTVGNATLSLDGGEGFYVSGLACPVQKTLLRGEKPATITGGTGEPFLAYDGNGTVKVEFIGWTDEAGNAYGIGDKPELTGDTTFYAVWKPVGETTIVTPEEPTEPTDPTPNDKPENDPTTPKTGDNSNVALWTALLVLSGAALVGMTAYDKKERA